MKNCLLAGVGGQGTVLASRLIAQCAINAGTNAKTAETIGMAQRGGCVVSHVRIGENVYSPLIALGQADVIIAFEPAEAVRVIDYLSDDGTVIVCPNEIKPTTDSLAKTSYNADEMIKYLKDNIKNLIIVDGNKICRECGSSKVLNVAMLGAAIQSGALGFSHDDAIGALKMLVPEKYISLNLKAFELGEKTVQ